MLTVEIALALDGSIVLSGRIVELYADPISAGEMR